MTVALLSCKMENDNVTILENGTIITAEEKSILQSLKPEMNAIFF